MKAQTLYLVISAILIFSRMSGAVDIYYDINFSSPEHTIGLPPAVGNQPTRPSSIVFGSPIVENSLGTWNDQLLVFNTAGNPAPFYYDQIRLDMSKNQSNYFVSFDIITESLLNSRNHFGVIFDSPYTVGVVDFMNDGRITLGGPRSPMIGNFEDDKVIHVEIATDLIDENWTIYINGSPLHTGPFLANTLQSMRFSLGLVIGDYSPSDDRTFIGLDNILVTNAIPEPATFLLLGLGAATLRTKNLKFKTKNHN